MQKANFFKFLIFLKFLRKTVENIFVFYINDNKYLDTINYQWLKFKKNVSTYALDAHSIHFTGVFKKSINFYVFGFLF